MRTFNLPDLGEGLTDAQIREWFINPGDTIELDQPLVSVETAKALVDIPAPFAGKVTKLYGNAGDNINVGSPLIEVETEAQKQEIVQKSDTVVGELKQDTTTMQTPHHQNIDSNTPPITPALRALARRLQVNLKDVKYCGTRMTAEDIKKHADQSHQLPQGFTPLSPIQQAMALNMQKSQQEVTPITLTDDADISAWFKQEDLTLRCIQALIHAVNANPLLNSHFNYAQMSYKQYDDINLGLAIDSPHGLFVPVIRAIQNLSSSQIREQIEKYKQLANTKSIPMTDLQEATIVLSNFGTVSGRYGTPIITPPMVAIVGVGAVYATAIVNNNALLPGHCLPVSVSADHRLLTGAQTANFLSAFVDSCQTNTKTT